MGYQLYPFFWNLNIFNWIKCKNANLVFLPCRSCSVIKGFIVVITIFPLADSAILVIAMDCKALFIQFWRLYGQILGLYRLSSLRISWQFLVLVGLVLGCILLARIFLARQLARILLAGILARILLAGLAAILAQVPWVDLRTYRIGGIGVGISISS